MFGIYTKITKYGKKFTEFCEFEYIKNQRKNRSFVFNRQKYSYFIHPYNCTWKNERTVEIPIIKKILEGYKDKKILEIGNVLSHYGLVSHDVLDKYETAENVINKDVADFKSLKKYDLIISISTLEHVGRDEKIKDNTKILKAILNLKKLLTNKGQIIITHPLGYNSNMDFFINNEKIVFKKKFALARKTKNNTWKQIAWEKNLKIKYGSPFPGANALLIGVLK